ncbi:protein Daple [Caerostris extrusa]|uniref:Protein Daple n=1 Tax=Caerostris extrusa TaxID=172846 RepID=A0AAV4X8Z2_CAEEX|nr:protein Daple [Caerostris extrusa]
MNIQVWEKWRFYYFLILGCAVQCERKEHFIEIIKSMDLDIQHKIVDYIQQRGNVGQAKRAGTHVQPFGSTSSSPSQRKDELSQRVIQSALQNLCFTSGTSTLSPTSSTSIDKSHLIVELADVKARFFLENFSKKKKNEGITELKEELEKSKESQCKLRQENLELIQDARTAKKTYRD